MNRVQIKAKKERKAYRDQRKALNRIEDRHYHTYGAAVKRQEERERRMAKS